MNKEYKEKIVKIIKDNSKWPLIVEGVTSKNFVSSIVLPANLVTTELGILIDDNGGFKYPDWVLELKSKATKSKRVVLCIDNLDKIDQIEQEKFYGVIKYKAINGYKFPQNAQIIVTVADGGIEKICKKILDACLVVKE